MIPNQKIRVLIVDDSALVRQVLSQGLALDPWLEVVGTAGDPYEARDMIVRLKPHVLTLDVEMPRMDGVEFLRKLMPQHPIPVVMVSALTGRGKRITLEALEAGAVDIVTKPSANVEAGLKSMIRELSAKVRIASKANVSHLLGRPVRAADSQQAKRALSESTDKVIAIGASTGGTQAITQILCQLPANVPGIVIVQHMPPGFTRSFADRLNEQSALIVKEAETGDRIMPGRALIAPGDKQMSVVRRGGIYEVICERGETVMGHCPSVEVLMQSVAGEVGRNAIGIMLTGMGRDGCTGLLAMKKAGAQTLAQDKESSVVWGMPKEAYELGAVDRLVAISGMAMALVRTIK